MANIFGEKSPNLMKTPMWVPTDRALVGWISAQQNSNVDVHFVPVQLHQLAA
jgi:hypothetical protein